MILARLALFALVSASANAATTSGVPDAPDVSRCDNCAYFPDSFLEVDEDALIDLAALPPAQRLDFMVGEWELIFPYEDADRGIIYTADLPIAFELVERWGGRSILRTFQRWLPHTSSGGEPFSAYSEYRYVGTEDRWQFTWQTPSTSVVYTGGLEEDGVIAFYEYAIQGDRRALHAVHDASRMRYVLRNITANQFVAEAYFSDDEGASYQRLDWQVLYRRRQVAQP